MNSIRLLVCLAILSFAGCQPNEIRQAEEISKDTVCYQPIVFPVLDNLPDTHLTELQPCDILIKPNLSFLPYMLRLPGGITWGHAAIVIQGATDTNEVELMKKVIVFESQARDVPGPYQLRLTPAYVPGSDFSYANYNFSPDKLGKLYRLRLELSESQRDSIIQYVLERDGDLSCYRALKRFAWDKDSLHRPDAEGGEPEFWYCSLLIWQAFYDVLGIDLDADKGIYVYPNDLVYSPYFNDTSEKSGHRVKF